MAGGNNSEGFTKSRLVLGDLTNRPGKRGFSESENSGNKNFNLNDNDKDLAKRIRFSSPLRSEISFSKENILLSISSTTDENRDANVLQFGRQAVSKSSNDVETDCNDGYCLKEKNDVTRNSKVCIGNKDIKILDLGGETDVSHSINKLDVDKDLVDSCGEIGRFDNNALRNMNETASKKFKGPGSTDLEVGKTISSIPTEALSKENEISGIAQSKCSSLKGNESDLKINDGGQIAPASSKASKENVLQPVDIKADDELSDTLRAVAETGDDCLDNEGDFDADESKACLEGSQSDVDGYHHHGDDHNADNLVLSQCGSVDCTILPESQESMVFGVEKFMETKNGNECAYMGGGTDSIEACSCSFCTKAGYIWLDLNYQDIKARVSALKKSQKEASIVAEKIIRSKGVEKYCSGSFTGVSKLESDLMYQWGSLFQHMAYVTEQESNQLEARLLPLNDLRDKCKTGLELIGAARSEKR